MHYYHTHSATILGYDTHFEQFLFCILSAIFHVDKMPARDHAVAAAVGCKRTAAVAGGERV